MIENQIVFYWDFEAFLITDRCASSVFLVSNFGNDDFFYTRHGKVALAKRRVYCKVKI